MRWLASLKLSTVCPAPIQLNSLQNAPITKKDRYRSPYRVMASNKANSRLMINYGHIQTRSLTDFASLSFVSLFSRAPFVIAVELARDKNCHNKAKIPFHKFSRLIEANCKMEKFIRRNFFSCETYKVFLRLLKMWKNLILLTLR